MLLSQILNVLLCYPLSLWQLAVSHVLAQTNILPTPSVAHESHPRGSRPQDLEDAHLPHALTLGLCVCQGPAWSSAKTSFPTRPAGPPPWLAVRPLEVRDSPESHFSISIRRTRFALGPRSCRTAQSCEARSGCHRAWATRACSRGTVCHLPQQARPPCRPPATTAPTAGAGFVSRACGNRLMPFVCCACFQTTDCGRDRVAASLQPSPSEPPQDMLTPACETLTCLFSPSGLPSPHASCSGPGARHATQGIPQCIWLPRHRG